MRCLITLLLSLIVLFIAGCGFHLQGKNIIIQAAPPKRLKILKLNSNNPHNPLIYAIKQQLPRLSNINLNDKDLENIPILKIISTFEHTKTVSVYQNGKSAEKELSFFVNAQIILPNNIIYQIKTHVERSFFDNPLEILASDTEKQFIKQEIYEQAASQLIYKLLIAYSIISNKSVELVTTKNY